MSDNASVVQRGIDQLNSDEAGLPSWRKSGGWLMIIDNQTGGALNWADAYEDSAETPLRTLKPGINVAHIVSTTFSFSARYAGDRRSFAIAASNPRLGSSKVNIHEQAANAVDVWKGMKDGDDKTATHGSRAFLASHGQYQIWGFVLSGSVPQSGDPAPLDTWNQIALEVKKEAESLRGRFHVYVFNHTGQTLNCDGTYEETGRFPFYLLHSGLNHAALPDIFSFAARYTGTGCAYRLALSSPIAGKNKIAISDEDGDAKQHWKAMDDGGDKTAAKGSRAYIRDVACHVMNDRQNNSHEVTKTVWVFEIAKYSG